MSITFTPTAGNTISYSYYIVDDVTPGNPGDDTANGVIRFQDDISCVNCHNSGGSQVLRALWLRDEPVGEALPEQIDRLLHRCDEQRTLLLEADPPDFNEYLYEKLGAIKDLLLHCKYHACGFTWS